MTAKLSISVPDDVADWLSGQPNASAAVAAARTDEVLRRAGIAVSADGKARWRARLAQPMDADVLDRGRRMLDSLA